MAKKKKNNLFDQVANQIKKEATGSGNKKNSSAANNVANNNSRRNKATTSVARPVGNHSNRQLSNNQNSVQRAVAKTAREMQEEQKRNRQAQINNSGTAKHRGVGQSAQAQTQPNQKKKTTPTQQPGQVATSTNHHKMSAGAQEVARNSTYSQAMASKGNRYLGALEDTADTLAYRGVQAAEKATGKDFSSKKLGETKAGAALFGKQAGSIDDIQKKLGERAAERQHRGQEQFERVQKQLGANDKTKKGKAIKTATEIADTIADIGIDSMAGPASLGVMAARAYGQEKRSALDAGATRAQAEKSAIVTGATEVASEKLFGANKIMKSVYGKGIADGAEEILRRNLAKVMSKKTHKNLAEAIANGGMSILEEALEEGIAEGIEPRAANLIYGNALKEQGVQNASGNLDNLQQKYNLNPNTVNRINTLMANDANADAIVPYMQQLMAAGATEEEVKQVLGQYLEAQSKVQTPEYLKAMLMGGAVGGILGGASIMMDYRNAQDINAQVDKAFGAGQEKQLIADVMKNAKDEAMAARAQALSEEFYKTGTISSYAVREMAQAQAEAKQSDYNKVRDSYTVAEKTMQEKNLISPAQTETLEYANQEAKTEAQEVVRKMQLPEGESDALATALANFATGTMTVEDISMFNVDNAEARTAFEEMTGLSLESTIKDNAIATNNATKDFIAAHAADNLVKVAEQHNTRMMAQVKDQMSADVTRSMGAAGQAVYDQVADSITLENAPEGVPQVVQAHDANMLFKMYYQAGRNNSMSVEELDKTLGDRAEMFSSELKMQAYEAGLEDKSSADAKAQAKGDNVSTMAAAGTAREGTLTVDVDEDSTFTASQERMFRLMAQSLGTNIRIVSTLDDGSNGFYQNNTITLAADNADRAIEYVFAHELTHHIKKFAPQQYNNLENLVRSNWEAYSAKAIAKGKIESGMTTMAEAVKRKQEVYLAHAKKLREREIANGADEKTLPPIQTLSEEDALEEIIADATYEMLNDRNFVKKACDQDIKLGEAILDAVRTMAARIRDVLTRGKGFVPSQNAGLLKQLDILEEFENLWLEGLAEARRNKAAVGVMTTRQRHSIIDVVGSKGFYGKGVYLDSDLFDGIHPRDWNKRLEEYVFSELAGKPLTVYNGDVAETVYVATKTDRAKKLNSKNANKVLNKLARNRNNDNLRALSIAHTEELAEVSFVDPNNESSNENVHGWLDENGWKYRKAYIVDKSGAIYQANLNIADGRNKKILYDINKIEKVDDGLVPSNVARPRTSTSDPMVSPGGNNVKRMSLSESFNQKYEEYGGENFKPQTEYSDGQVKYSVSTEYIPHAIGKISGDLSDVGGSIYVDVEAELEQKEFTARELRNKWAERTGLKKKEIKALDKIMDNVANWLQGPAEKEYTYLGLRAATSATLEYRVDKDGNPTSVILSAMVKNGEYPINFDFTSVCKKRVAFQKLMSDIAKNNYDEVDLSPENIKKINDILEAHGFEVACPICFVEARRYNNQAYVDKIVNKWNETVLAKNPNAKKLNAAELTPEKLAEMQEQIDEAWAYYDVETKKLKDDALAKKKADPELKKRYEELKKIVDKEEATDEELEEFAELEGASWRVKVDKLTDSDVFQVLLSAEDLLTEEGTRGLKSIDRLFGLLKQSRGASAPKETTAFTAYNSEVAMLMETFHNKLSKAKKAAGETGADLLRKKLYEIGGVRMQSFSDFQIQHVYDYMQLIGDMAAGKLPAHAYSKELAFAELFGMTGMKINLSVVCDIDPNVDSAHAGLTKDENGNWVYNIGKQSIDYDKAVELQNRPGYTGNIGIIMVVMSDEHMKMALNDPNVRYIIPYHKSGLPVPVQKATSIDMARDFTNRQNSMRITSIKPAGDSKAKSLDVAKIMKEIREQYSDPSKAIKAFNDKIAAENLVVGTKSSGHGPETVGADGKTSFDIYADLKKTNDPRQTAKNYIAWCMEANKLPICFEFADHPDYYKMLFDFNTIDNKSGKTVQQGPVQNIYPGVNAQKGESDITKLTEVIGRYMEEQNDINKVQDAKYQDVVSEVLQNVAMVADSIEENEHGDEKKHSVKDQEYLDAVERGDMETAQKMVLEAAADAGYINRLLHGSPDYGYTEYDLGESDDGISIFLTPSEEVAETYSGVSGVRRIGDDVYEWLDKLADARDDAAYRFEDEANKLAGVRSYIDYGSIVDTMDKVWQEAEDEGDSAGYNIDYAFYEYVQENIVPGFFWGNEAREEEYEYDVDEFLESEECETFWEAYRALCRTYDAYNKALNEGTSGAGNYDLVAKIQDPFVPYGTEGKNWRTLGVETDDGQTLNYTREVAEYAKENGYDGVILRDISDNGDFGSADTNDVYIVFSSNQIKSADPVTYDDNGNVIPLSQRFNQENEDIRWSVKDSEGNTLSTEQQEYFKDSKVRDEEGNLLVLYHGTEESGHTVFDRDMINFGQGFFFSTNLETARGYSGTHDIFEPNYANGLESVNEYLHKTYEDDNIIEKDDGYWLLDSYGDENFMAEDISDVPAAIDDWYGLNTGAANYKTYVNLVNPLIVDAKGRPWDEIEVPAEMLEEDYGFGEYTSTNAISSFAYHNGYDGVIVRNVQDNGLYSSDRFGTATDVIAFNSNQIKDVNNKMPTENEDIRYSLSEGVGYHAGDLGKSEPLAEMGAYRDTGHFGTGTYFVGNPEKIKDHNSRDGKPAPMETIDVSGYNLFRPWDSERAYELHRFLRDVNTYYDYVDSPKAEFGYVRDIERKLDDLEYELDEMDEDDENYWSTIDKLLRIAWNTIGVERLEKIIPSEDDDSVLGYKDAMDVTRRDISRVVHEIQHPDYWHDWRSEAEDVRIFFKSLDAKVIQLGVYNEGEAVKILRNIKNELEGVSYEESLTHDTASTMFMKALGYEGIDVRHTELDNTRYGSVIYDLKGEDLERKNEIGTARFSVPEEEYNQLAEERKTLKDPVSQEAAEDYMAENQDEYDELPVADQRVMESRGRREAIKEEALLLMDKLNRDTRLTHGEVLNKKSVSKQLRELVKEVMVNSDARNKNGRKIRYKQSAVEQLTDAAYVMWKQIQNDQLDEAVETAYDAALQVVDDLDLVIDDAWVHYKDVRDYLRNTAISIPEENRDSKKYNEWRKANMGRIKVTNDGRPIDEAYSELSELWPKLFSPEIINPEEQAERLSDALDEIKPYAYAYSSEEADMLAKDISTDFVTIVYAGEAWKSYADKSAERYAQKTAAMKTRHQEAMRKLRQEMNDKYNRAMAEANWKAAERDLANKMHEGRKTAAMKSKYQKNVKTLKRKHDEAMMDARWKDAEKDLLDKINAGRKEAERKREAAEKRANKRDHRERMKSFGKIKKNYEWLASRLVSPTDSKHIPELLRQPLAEFLQQVDLQTERSKKLEEKYGKVAGTTVRMHKLRSAIEDIAAKGEEMEVDEGLMQILKELADGIDGRPIDELTTEEIKRIDILFRALRHSIHTQNTFFSQQQELTISEAAQKCFGSWGKRIERKGPRSEYSGLLGMADRIINESQVTPRDFFEHIGGGVWDLYQGGLRKGLDTQIKDMDKLRNMFGDIFTQYGNKKKPGSKIESWIDSTNKRTFNLENGQTVTMTPAHIMSLYASMMREQAVGHILGGGITVTTIDPDFQTKNLLKQGANAAKKALGTRLQNNGASVHVSYSDCMNIINTLTEEQKAVANQLLGVLQTVSVWGNEASMAMYGYRKFTEANYFPIKSSDNWLNSDYSDRQSVERIKNFGFTKGTVVNANNPIVIDDIFSVVADHCNKMTLYHAYAPAIADMTRLLNYKTREEDGTPGPSVKSVLETAYGKQAMSYINKFMSDVQNQTAKRKGGFEHLFNKVLSNSKKAAIAGSLSVALQQPTAIVRALAVMNPIDFRPTPGAAMRVPQNMREVKEHCPIALWKSWGFSQTDLAADMKDIMMNREWNKLDAITMELYGKLDDFTWSCIWDAVKNETRRLHKDVPEGSEEFWRICGERAAEVFDSTQVVDSPFHRSDVMRSQDMFIKTITSFMAEPTRTFNMIRSDVVKSIELNAEGKHAEAAATFGRMATVFVANAAAVSAAKAIADALRAAYTGDDKDDGPLWEIWLEKFYDNFKGNVNPLGLMPYFGQAFSDYGFSSMATEYIGDFISDSKKLFDLIKEGEVGGENWWKTMLKSIKDLSYVTGLPIKNVLREFEMASNMFGLQVFADSGEDTIEFADGSQMQIHGESWKDKLIDYIPFVGEDGDGEGGETPASEYDDSGLFNRHTSWFDDLIGRTSQDKVQKQIDSYAKDALDDAKGKTGEEYYKSIYASVCNKGNIKDDVSLEIAIRNGDYGTVKQMRSIIEKTGNQDALDYFDEQAFSKSKSAFKKTIGSNDENAITARGNIREYLKEQGMTDKQITQAVVTGQGGGSKCDTAKEFQKAYALRDHDAAVDLLVDLIYAGVDYDDYVYLAQNAHRTVKASDFATGEFEWPIDQNQARISSHVGHRSSPGGIGSTNHKGIDIAMAQGSEVRAADGGKVVYSGYNSARGKYIVVDHGNGTETLYQHLSWYEATKGQVVKKGQYIGNVGSTGHSTGPHLHLELHVNGQVVDPEAYLPSFGSM